MIPQPPPSFTNPCETEIIKLEHEYKRALAEGKVFEELKQLRVKIKSLKSELSMQRSRSENENA